jgi:hypothetical protein
MNPMAYRGPGQTLVGYEPPPAWSPPTPEQESLREPWIDPTAAFSGGFGANIMRRGLMGALRGGTAAAIADYPLGLATAGVEQISTPGWRCRLISWAAWHPGPALKEA